MFTSRYVVSASLLNSAASAEDIGDDLGIQDRRVEPRGAAVDAGPTPPTSLGYVARLREDGAENRRSGENATNRSRSASRPDARLERGGEAGPGVARSAGSSRR